MNDISLFHMVDGKTVIARVKYQAADTIVVTRPCEIVIVPADRNSKEPPQLLFAPYLTMYGALPAVEELELRGAHIVLQREAPQKLQDGYVEVTSDIQIARTY
jgi:hypothetical protein